MIELISNAFDINAPDDYAIWMFFSKKSSDAQKEVSVTLLEEQALSFDLLHHSGQFRLEVSKLVKSFKYLTKLS